MKTPPLMLYKFFKWSDKPRDKMKDILYKNILYFSNPLTFNDPFDSKIPIQFDENYRASKDFHKDFLKADNTIGKTTYTDQQMLDIAEDYFLNPHKIIYDTEIMTKSIQQSINESFRITCFSTKRNNILMWSHYADRHTGVCIGFKTIYLLLDPNLVELKEVNYVTKFPKFTSLTGMPIVTTKSKDWKYENEYRLINLDAHPLIAFQKEAISEVIIGYRMDSLIKDKLLAYLNKRYPNVDVFITSPSNKSFKMEIIKIDNK
jgi:hypothetical protein